MIASVLDDPRFVALFDPHIARAVHAATTLPVGRHPAGRRSPLLLVTGRAAADPSPAMASRTGCARS
jgi:hypothetical protein